MILSTRADPPRFLNLPKTQKTSTFKHLIINSPLPSPSLPSILPRHGKKPPKLNSRKALRLLSWLFLMTLIFWVNQRLPRTSHFVKHAIKPSSGHRLNHVTASEDLPRTASPVVVTDKRGRSHWTVSIPSNLNFPLSASGYDVICRRIGDISTIVANDHQNLHKVQHLHYAQADPNYVDIGEAQQTGMLPVRGYTHKFPNAPKMCETSLTYVLDAAEAGLGDALIGLWLAYGLAQREGRAFFIDYSNFAYGKFTSLFSQLPPNPDCRPPPWEQRTPCPNYAKHLLVSSSTTEWTFGPSFQKEYSTQDVFDMARQGYEALFNMKEDDVQYVQGRLAEMRRSAGENGVLVGMHIRRGDRHPFEFQYQQGYLPPSKYMSAARQLTLGHPGSVIMLASDDADIYHHPELEGSVRAQERIALASNKRISSVGVGWEGGFFKDAFWSIGLPEHALNQKYIGSPVPTRKTKYHKGHHTVDHHRNYRSQPTKEALQQREYIGRAYMLDLAVLAGGDEVICGVSSKGCRILAIMMGWDKLHQGHWRNVDGAHGWRALF